MQERNVDYLLHQVRRRIKYKMDLVFETCLAQDSDFPVVTSPIWIFGRSYSIHYDLDELRRAVSTTLWITYRKNFPSIGDTSLTSDRGWGCMIRGGQMLIAKALLLRHMGDHWHWQHDTRDPKYLQLMTLFADSRSAHLSLHQIAQSGESLGKPIGSWLGPNTVAQALNRLLLSESLNIDLQMFISMDSTVVKSEIKRTCLDQKYLQGQGQNNVGGGGFIPNNSYNCVSINTPRTDPNWKPLLLVVPLRLGLSDLNSSYIPGIKSIFEISQSIGIIGGRPNHALYFIGYAENEVLYLDPHTVQQCGTVGSKIHSAEITADGTYHVDKPGRMSFHAIDPSLAVCFYCKSEADFDSLCAKLTERFSSIPLPLFEICEHVPDFSDSNMTFVQQPSTSSSSSSSFTTTKSSKSSGFTGLSGFTTIGSRSLNKSPHSFSSGTSSPRKSDVDDEEFEILG